MIDINQNPQKIRGEKFISLASGMGFAPIILEFNSKDPVQARKTLANLMSNLKSKINKSSGVFVSANDSFTTQIFIALHTAGINLGKDIELVSIADDPNIANVLDGKMTIIDLQPEEIGRAAAQTLLWRLQNPVAPQRRLQISPIIKPRGLI
jgi:DNA-binding LacI/PurR family transcriptional regulator